MCALRACVAGLLGLMLCLGAQAQHNQTQNKGSSLMLDTLFDKLQTATDPFAIQSLEAAIWEQWMMVPGDAERQLMMRGIAEMEQQELESAAVTFTRLIDMSPELSEAWN